MASFTCDRLVLAPMEGVLDPLMRELLTAINPYDLCVTEFVRVVDALLPARTYYKLAPELRQGGKTRSGTPVRVQLLGQSPEWMAENAVLAAQLGSPGSTSTLAVRRVMSTSPRVAPPCSRSQSLSIGYCRPCARRCRPRCHCRPRSA